MKNYLTTLILCTTLGVVGQVKTCSSASHDVLDLNTIGKCAIEKFKQSNKKEYVQISSRNRYVRRKESSYLANLRKNVKASSVAKKVIYTMDNVDNLPVFSSCKSSVTDSRENQLACFKSEIESYVYASLNYPDDALAKNLEDKVLTTFIINTNGYAKDIKVESTKHIISLENEAKRIINDLPQLKPGKHNGVATEVRHKVYVNFEIAKKSIETVKKEALVSHDEEYIKDFLNFDLVTEKPIFVTCADVGVDVRQECIKETITQDILDNLIYPFDAAAEGVEGRVWVRFVIDKDGYVTNITTSGPENGVLLEEEAERLVKLLPKFLPGKQNGEYVNVEYFIPFDFHLDE